MQANRRKAAISYHLYDHSQKQFFTLRDGTVCGRAEGSIRFPEDDIVSRRHCRFRIVGNDVYIENLSETNQTRVNQVPMQPGGKRRVLLHDVIEFGGRRLILTSQPAVLPPGGLDQASERRYKAYKRADGSLSSEITHDTARTMLLVDRASFSKLQVSDFLRKKTPRVIPARRRKASRRKKCLQLSYGVFAALGVLLFSAGCFAAFFYSLL